MTTPRMRCCERAQWNVKAAILMQQTGVTRATALSRLRVEPRLRKLLGRG